MPLRGTAAMAGRQKTCSPTSATILFQGRPDRRTLPKVAAAVREPTPKEVEQHLIGNGSLGSSILVRSLYACAWFGRAPQNRS
eukprot:4685967-Amphidinium_carterae.1